jgi:serine/threonine protein kinase
MSTSRELTGKSQLRLFVDRVIHSRYKIINEIGKGGMGAVFEAVDLTCDRRVAIKQTAATDPTLLAAALPQKAGYQLIYEANGVSASKSHSYTVSGLWFLRIYRGQRLKCLTSQ